MTFPDRARLREALALYDETEFVNLALFLEAARLVASETTLIVEKVNGEWDVEHVGCEHLIWSKVGQYLSDEEAHQIANGLLDALLAQQQGDIG